MLFNIHFTGVSHVKKRQASPEDTPLPIQVIVANSILYLFASRDVWRLAVLLRAAKSISSERSSYSTVDIKRVPVHKC